MNDTVINASLTPQDKSQIPDCKQPFQPGSKGATDMSGANRSLVRLLKNGWIHYGPKRNRPPAASVARL